MMRFPNLAYRSAVLKGKMLRMAYHALIPAISRTPAEVNARIGANVYSLSCERDLPEQVASIRSFIRHAGMPAKFTVVSDGSYSTTSCETLEKISPCVRVIELGDFLRRDLPASVVSYSNMHFLGKKLAFLMSMPVSGPTIYSDSDIIFFPGSSELRIYCEDSSKRPWYLLDSEFSLDRKILYGEAETSNPINAGFLLLFEELDWRMAIDRLDRYDGVPAYFTEQTIVHLTMHQAQARQLDPDRFVCRRDDENIFADKYCNLAIALRHYVGPIRHKFWSFLFC